MVDRQTWDAFREAGLLWWINRGLHLFGWAIAVEVDERGKVSEAYPVRTRFRGFDEQSETEGFKKVTTYLANNITSLSTDMLEDDIGEPP